MGRKPPKERTQVKGAPGIYRRGERFEYRLYWTDATGPREERIALPLGTTKEQAVDARASDIAKIHTKTYIPRTNLTLSQVFHDHFLPARAPRPGPDGYTRGLEESSWQSYREKFVLYVEPRIGHLVFRSIEPGRITALLDELAAPRNGERGRPRTHPPEVYETIVRRRLAGDTYIAIANDLRVVYGPRYTRSVVAHIWFREQARQATAVPARSSLSLSTVNFVADLLSSCWTWAIKNGLGERNIVKFAERPRSKAPKKDKLIWTPEQVQAFFAWPRTQRHRMFPLWFFLTTSGERRGANLGLRWSDVDFDEATATLSWYVGEVNSRTVVKGYSKSGSPGHKLILDGHTLALLRQEKARYAARVLAEPVVHRCPSVQPYCGLEGFHDRGLVFPGPMGDYQRPAGVLDELQRMIARYNRAHPAAPLPRIDVHSLRHAWSTLAGHLGFSSAVRQDRLDHSSPIMTMEYTQALEVEERDAAEAVSTRLFGLLDLGVEDAR